MMDITGMSVLKNDLLWPESIIKEEYRDKREEILDELKQRYIYDDNHVFGTDDEINKYLTFCYWGYGKIFSSGQTPAIYFDNLGYYLKYKCNFFINLTLDNVKSSTTITRA